MAEALARHFMGDAIEPFSAGTEPKGIDPRAAKALAEIGIDISGARSRHVDEFSGACLDYVVTLCGHANETCPFFPGKTKVVHRGFDDPPLLAAGATDEEAAMAHYRRVRDEILEFVKGLPGSLREGDWPVR